MLHKDDWCHFNSFPLDGSDGALVTDLISVQVVSKADEIIELKKPTEMKGGSLKVVQVNKDVPESLVVVQLKCLDSKFDCQ